MTLMAKRGSEAWRQSVRDGALKKIADDPQFLARRGAAIRAGHANNPKVRTHCKRGHELTWENTEISGAGYLVCRSCHNRARRQSRVRLIAEMVEETS